MDILVGILVGAAAIIVVLFVLGRRALAPGVDPTQLTFDPSVMAEVRTLAVSGDKIRAIKLLRDQNPGLGLASAKQLVDRMALSAQRPKPAGAAPVADPALPRDQEPPMEAVGVDTMPSSSTVPLDVELDARNFKAQGRTAAAVTLIAEQTGCTAAEAATYVAGL